MAHIDVFFSTLSPFTYLAGLRLPDIAARHGASVTYKPLDIMALFDRTGGVRPADRHPSRLAYRLQELRRQSAKAGMALYLKPMFWPTNPAPSSYAIIAAQATGAEVGPLAHALAARSGPRTAISLMMTWCAMSLPRRGSTPALPTGA